MHSCGDSSSGEETAYTEDEEAHIFCKAGPSAVLFNDPSSRFGFEKLIKAASADGRVICLKRGGLIAHKRHRSRLGGGALATKGNGGHALRRGPESGEGPHGLCAIQPMRAPHASRLAKPKAESASDDILAGDVPRSGPSVCQVGQLCIRIDMHIGLLTKLA